jgi:predicted GTPase
LTLKTRAASGFLFLMSDKLTVQPGRDLISGCAFDPVDEVVADVRAVNPAAAILRAASPVTLAGGPLPAGSRVLVVEDGPTITHGGMPFGAGTVAARAAGAELVDPRPYAAGSIADTFARFPHIGPVLPAMGYSDGQLAELLAPIVASATRS